MLLGIISVVVLCGGAILGGCVCGKLEPYEK